MAGNRPQDGSVLYADAYDLVVAQAVNQLPLTVEFKIGRRRAGIRRTAMPGLPFFSGPQDFSGNLIQRHQNVLLDLRQDKKGSADHERRRKSVHKGDVSTTAPQFLAIAYPKTDQRADVIGAFLIRLTSLPIDSLIGDVIHAVFINQRRGDGAPPVSRQHVFGREFLLPDDSPGFRVQAVRPLLAVELPRRKCPAA